MLPFFNDDQSKSLSQLIDLRGEFRTDSIIMAIDDRIQRIALDPSTRAEAVILAVEELERQVNSGGFESFFTNYPEYAKDIVSFLQLIRCHGTAEIAEAAVNKLGINDLDDSNLVRENASRANFVEEDDAFIAYPDDIVEHLLDFIEANQSSIRIEVSPPQNDSPKKSSWFERLFSK